MVARNCETCMRSFGSNSCKYCFYNPTSDIYQVLRDDNWVGHKEPIDLPQVMTESDPGDAKGSNYFDDHYAKGAIQPIEFMQETFTKEEFRGFLMGNIVKYTSRLGKKDSTAKEAAKIKRYSEWLQKAENGEKINPREG